MITEEDRRALLACARDVIAAYTRREPEPPQPATPALGQSAGVFVSLHKHGDLRGCIGHLEGNEPLVQVVARCARAACSTDPRFSPVTEGELPDISIEVSVLGPSALVTSLDEIEIGRHGLLVEKGRQRGLLLPQVATEWKWDPRTFVEQTCRKAGLPADAWEHGAQLWRFEAEVFSERDLSSEVRVEQDRPSI